MSASTDDQDVVLYRQDEGVAVLTLNRPERLNAWTPAMETRYFDLLTACDDDPEVRAIVVTGAGRGFCAGADMTAVVERSTGGPPRIRQRPLTFPTSIRKPLIAAINGGCVGLGLLQALMCDVRFAASDAKIATAFARRGIPAEFGMTWLLDRLVGPANAADLLLTGRPVLGSEAATMGLVSRSYGTQPDLLEAVMAFAHDIATNCSPAAMATIKRQLQAEPHRSHAESETESVLLMDDPSARPDFQEGVAAFREKRAPRFAGLGPRSQ